jgi:TldD protein
MVDITIFDRRIDRRTFIRRGIEGGMLLALTPMILDQLRGQTALAEEALVEPGFGRLGKEDLERLLAIALEDGGDFADVYAERRIRRNISLEEDKISAVQYGIDQGVGIRVTTGLTTGYACSDDFAFEKLADAARTASFIARNKPRSRVAGLSRREAPRYIWADIDLETIAERERVAMMRRANEAAKAYSPKVQRVSVSYEEETKQIMVANSRGVWAEDTQPLIYFTVYALGRDGEARHMGRHRVSEHMGFEFFEEHSPEDVAKEAAREAVAMLEAVPAPAGEMPVVVIQGWGGVLFHEAVGHGLEADAIVKGSSYLKGKLGHRVASDLVTVNIDDEGTPTQRNILIDRGIVRQYMTDIVSADALGVKPTGNGRRESYRYYPLVRMTNTFLLNGEHEPDEIVRATKNGLYARAFSGGVVDTTSGSFTFTVREAYLIEDGKITRPVRGATLIGSGGEALKSIDMVANNLAFGPGTCGKGQWVPVTSGQPTLRMGKITVGGTAV